MTLPEELAAQKTVFEEAEIMRKQAETFMEMNKEVEAHVYNGLPPTFANLIIEPGAYAVLLDDGKCACLAHAALHVSQLGAWLEGELVPNPKNWCIGHYLPIEPTDPDKPGISIPLHRVIGILDLVAP